MIAAPAYLVKPCIPGDAPEYTGTHDNALAWLEHLERHEIGEWLALPQDAVFSMVPSCLDPSVPLTRKARIIALLAAQIHPEALAWLGRLSHKIEPALRPLAQVAWQQAAIRTQALTQCLALGRQLSGFIK